MKANLSRKGLTLWASCVGTAGTFGLLSVFGLATPGLLEPVPAATSPTPTSPASTVVANRYIGVAKCKNCHSTEESGNQHGEWESSPHAKAFEALASDAAKKVAAERGIADPQKADECIKCHMTAFGVDEGEIKRGFKLDLGVQCETCHGPGEQHMKARFAAAAAENADMSIEPGEILGKPSKALCVQCHNPESPTYKEFCFHDASSQISHLRPERAKEVAALGIADCTSCHTTGAELIDPKPALCTTCHDPVPAGQ